MQTPFLGQIAFVGFNFAPVGWHLCDGSLLSIAENSALYNLIGTTYGGDGVTSFGLPDLRGRVPVCVGQGAGLGSYILGQNGGVESVTLTMQSYPQHTHNMQATQSAAGTVNPAGAVLGSGQQIYTEVQPAEAMNQAMCTMSNGGNGPHENRQAYQAANWIIALEGIYPSQN